MRYRVVFRPGITTVADMKPVATCQEPFCGINSMWMRVVTVHDKISLKLEN
jgi:hypothetical protein